MVKITKESEANGDMPAPLAEENARLLARIAELEADVSQRKAQFRAAVRIGNERTKERDRLRAEVEALRNSLRECELFVRMAGLDSKPAEKASEHARTLLAQPAGSWVNPLAAEVEKCRSDAERYACLKSMAKIGITKRQEFIITLDLVPCPNHIGELDLALDDARKGASQEADEGAEGDQEQASLAGAQAKGSDS